MSDLHIAGANLIKPIDTPGLQQAGQTGEAGGANFLGSLKEAIGHINDAQTGASQAVESLVTGQNTNIHQTMVALQQADASFQLMMQVRNKLVTAYEEIQRMQI
ncbi:MAG TPA: flagellar hook-basal body complex protein FliE [Nitrospira sp.]|nr:flagellar hook-basal body complex protein FliE [Nitrospira sp.]MCE7978151.1 flagellar hook-basal body complex protein FliE [Nitrospira sp. NTP1]HQR14567.1 flagellar hook-basal body complex protein FliE [Nitrospira sp.]HQV12272.1 flagellar hook-basal body complex protein FliE [Nitrospira sp.]